VIVSDTDELTVDGSWLSTQPAVATRLGMSGTLAFHTKRRSSKTRYGPVEDECLDPRGRPARLGIPRSTLESKIRTLKINKKPLSHPSANAFLTFVLFRISPLAKSRLAASARDRRTFRGLPNGPAIASGATGPMLKIHRTSGRTVVFHDQRSA